MINQPKKLIEVALPLAAINEGSKPETENPFLKGHPRAVHNWWARTPLSVSRAVLFAQLIDDPGDGLPPKDARRVREILLDFVAKLATWEASTNRKLIEKAREMIRAQFKNEIPEFWDMFAGRASIPIEAQRLGLKVTSSDLNPVAVTIQRALLEFPPKFKNRPPVHPDSGQSRIKPNQWKGVSGLIEDIRWFGEWVRHRATIKLEKLYPKGLKGERIVAWIWARTVECPNPACRAHMPLVRSFSLSTKKGKRAFISPNIDKAKKEIVWDVEFADGPVPKGTVTRTGATCIFCNSSVDLQYIRDEGKAGRILFTMMAAVAEGNRGPLYLPPMAQYVRTAEKAVPLWTPDTELPPQALGFRVQLYGMTRHCDLFTPRQLTALSTLCDGISDAHEEVMECANGDREYADAVCFYLACALSRLTDYHNNLCTWNPTNENVGHLFQRQAIPIVWDFVEACPIYGKLSYAVAADWVASSLEAVPVDCLPARVIQLDARKMPPQFSKPPVISTDPPYYDNIGYADLSDFFYTWLRRVLKDIDFNTFATLLSPKEPELIASRYRHNGSYEEAERHFREGFALAFGNMYRLSNVDVPMTVYYAFRQQENEEDADDDAQRSSTGWETMLEGLVNAGFQITGTWPVRTTKKARSVARKTNALASAVVLVARQRPVQAPVATRKEFLSALRRELPRALKHLLRPASLLWISHRRPLDQAWPSFLASVK